MRRMYVSVYGETDSDVCVCVVLAPSSFFSSKIIEKNCVYRGTSGLALLLCTDFYSSTVYFQLFL